MEDPASEPEPDTKKLVSIAPDRDAGKFATARPERAHPPTFPLVC
jgi:hypothetical protein